MTEQEKINLINDVNASLGDWLGSGEDYYLQQAQAKIARAVNKGMIDMERAEQESYIAEGLWGAPDAVVRNTPEEALEDIFDKCNLDAGDMVSVISCKKTLWLPLIDVNKLMLDFQRQAILEAGERSVVFIDALNEANVNSVSVLERKLNDVLMNWLVANDIVPDWLEPSLLPEGCYQFDGKKFVRIGDV